MPIGNLTSQIFANIYLNELDRFVKHELGIKYYLRYGDDFILVHPDLEKLQILREQTVLFLKEKLKLNLNPKNDKIVKANHGLRFLGVVIWPRHGGQASSRNLNKRNRQRIKSRLNVKNAGSYYGLVNKHASTEFTHEFKWWICELLADN